MFLGFLCTKTFIDDFSEEVEEVFAEDYDDPSKPEIMEASLPEEQAEPVVAEMTPSENPLFFETTACPFRY